MLFTRVLLTKWALMNRRDFIKNSLIVAGGISCFICGGKFIYNFDKKNNSINGVYLTKDDLLQKYIDKNDLPRKIYLDACTFCQLKCPGCSMMNYPNIIGFGYLKFKDFKKLVDENDFDEIGLANHGEIFLNPELVKILKYGYEKNITLTAENGANLNSLTDEQAEALVKYQFNLISVLIDSASPETYKTYRIGGDFNTVINNIKKINSYKKKYNSVFPYLNYQFTVFGHNEHEIDKAKKLARELDMGIFFKRNYSTDYSPIKNPVMVSKKTGMDFSIQQSSAYIDDYKKDHRKWWNCKDLWKSPQINWDGRLLGCCSNFGNDFGGNVFKEGFQKTLNNPKLIYAKNMIANNNPPIEGLPCTTCNTYWVMKEKNLIVKPRDLMGNTWF